MATEDQKFQFWAPVRVYDDVTKGEAKRRRIAGIISDEGIDSQGEAILQRGMDFSYFLQNGTYNNDHQPGMENILGWPTDVKHFAKGDVLPDGTLSQRACTWTEGFLSNRKNADAVWELARDMEGTGRSLGFSVEGQIVSREGPEGRVIGKANINHVAITAQPVNTGTKLIPLLRSLTAIEKAVTTDSNAANERENLSNTQVNCVDHDKKRRRKRANSAKKSLYTGEALKSVFELMPEASIETAIAMLQLTELGRVAKALEAEEED